MNPTENESKQLIKDQKKAINEEGLKLVRSLYDEFHKYPKPSSMPVHSPAHSSEYIGEIWDKLSEVEVNEADGNHLSKYVFHSMSTWGDPEDLLPWVPRIIELMLSQDPYLDLPITCSKIGYVSTLLPDENILEKTAPAFKHWYKSLLALFATGYVSYGESLLDVADSLSMVNVDVIKEIQRWSQDANTKQLMTYAFINSYGYENIAISEVINVVTGERPTEIDLSKEEVRALSNWVLGMQLPVSELVQHGGLSKEMEEKAHWILEEIVERSQRLKSIASK